MERFIEADLWTLLMLDEDRQELYYAITAGGEDSALRNLRVKVGDGIAGWVAEHGETLLVPETQNDPRLKTALGDQSRVVRSVIALPLRGRKGRTGVIEIFNPARRPAHRLHHRFPAHPGRPCRHRHGKLPRRGPHSAATITDDCTASTTSAISTMSSAGSWNDGTGVSCR